MLDSDLFYVNKKEGWIEKEKYFERMTQKAFLTIQNYKDVTVNADSRKADPSNIFAGYIPEKFPKGNNWNIILFEKINDVEYGPYKIRTDAFRYVETWDYVFDEDLDTKIWKKRLDKNGNVVKVKDEGLLIHGGGYSESDLDNKKGSNKYTDTTLGCIRISNLDVYLIVHVLQNYINVKGSISLEVK